MKQLPSRHSDPLLRFYHLLAVLELVHRLRVVPACSVVVTVTQDVEDPFGIDGFGPRWKEPHTEAADRGDERIGRLPERSGITPSVYDVLVGLHEQVYRPKADFGQSAS